MLRAYYSSTIPEFLTTPTDSILGELTKRSDFDLGQAQRDAWLVEIAILRSSLSRFDGSVYLEYSIPRMGKRIDAVLLIGAVIFVVEFKVGERQFKSHEMDQVWDYALDLGNFHETSHDQCIAPILIATKSADPPPYVPTSRHKDKLLDPIKSSVATFEDVILQTVEFASTNVIDRSTWEQGRYRPTPTIIEAALALYSRHSVDDISRSDASAINLRATTQAISEIIRASRDRHEKSVCFVTGVPGAGKTLVGLNIATQHIDKASDLHSVFLSGNGPLVSILREALARDKVKRLAEQGEKVTRSRARSEVSLFIQNVHHFRDECLRDSEHPPLEHVAIFDEAQRAWNLEQTAGFMKRKKGVSNFDRSEPEFLISCLDRHADWAVIVCLVGGGQEINTGEAGIGEWIESLNRSFPAWHVYVSNRLNDSEFGTSGTLRLIESRRHVVHKDELHLSVSMRSFRSESVSSLVKVVLDLDTDAAKVTLNQVKKSFPIAITRDIAKAKNWLRERARGSERYGMVVSSQAERLKPHAIYVKAPMNPIHWFLGDKDDVRSSFFLEDVATEFHVQGLELDWACVTWDADFRFTKDGWQHWSFVGAAWQRIKKAERQTYLKNAYRVLLTRARQGMVIVVPPGDADDPTRRPDYYDPTYEYLKGIGFEVI